MMTRPTNPSPITPPLPDAPPPRARPYSRTTVWLVLALAALVMGLWWLGTPPGLDGKANAIGYAICHQIAERSFDVHGHPLPLCARCTGMYLGVMVGFGLLVAGGRGRAAAFPPRRVLVIFGLFVVILGIDGVNSYLHLFPGYIGPYQPQNWMRLITGSLTGLAMITIIMPVFTFTVWRRARARRVISGLRELAGVLLVIGLVDALVLLRSPLLLTVFGAVSAIGPVLLLTLVWSILFLSVTRRENTVERPAQLILPLLAGLTLTFIMLGAIAFARFQFTGTWAGFELSMFS